MEFPAHPLAIEDVALGRRLVNIKNQKPLVYGPLILSANATLTVRQFIQMISAGLLVDTNAGSVSITMPSAAAVLAAIPLNQGEQLKFSIGSIATAAGANVVNVLAGTNFVLANNAAIAIAAQTTRNAIVTYVNAAGPTLAINIS
jgi:hypothetical protein